tara:strand:+ start:163 stop:1029 length:867 start_codon:yes stop_codon:yes gene_type:complete
MFSVLDKVKKRTRREVLNILLIQHGYDSYCQDFTHLNNVNIYLYDGSSWSIPQELTPSNFLFIQDHSTPMVGCFDKIICIGKSDEAKIAQEIQKRFGVDLILLHNSSEENYCPRPFTFNVKEKVQTSANAEVSMSKHFGYGGMTTILPVEVWEAASKKQDSVVIFNHVPSGIVQAMTSLCQDIQLLEFSPDNLSSSKVFLDTVIGLTPHLIKAMSYGCIPIVPYCSEAKKLLGGKGHMYHKYEDINNLVRKALESETSQHEIRELASECYTSKKDFINKWNHILGRSI